MPKLSAEKVAILENMQVSRFGRLNHWEEIDYIDLLELADEGLIRHEYFAESLLSVEWFLTERGHQLVLP